MVKLLIKKLDKNIILPEYKTESSSGMDLTANIKESILLSTGKIIIIPTGIAVSIPLGHELQIRPRSGLAAKNGIGVLNAPGTIDADYRGEVKVILINLGGEDLIFLIDMVNSCYSNELVDSNTPGRKTCKAD